MIGICEWPESGTLANSHHCLCPIQAFQHCGIRQGLGDVSEKHFSASHCTSQTVLTVYGFPADDASQPVERRNWLQPHFAGGHRSPHPGSIADSSDHSATLDSPVGGIEPTHSSTSCCPCHFHASHHHLELHSAAILRMAPGIGVGTTIVILDSPSTRGSWGSHCLMTIELALFPPCCPGALFSSSTSRLFGGLWSHSPYEERLLVEK